MKTMQDKWQWSRILVYATTCNGKLELGIFAVRPEETYSQRIRRISRKYGYHIDELSYEKL